MEKEGKKMIVKLLFLMVLDFTKFKTPDQLFQKTGLTVEEALSNIDKEIKKLKNSKGGESFGSNY